MSRNRTYRKPLGVVMSHHIRNRRIRKAGVAALIAAASAVALTACGSNDSSSDAKGSSSSHASSSAKSSPSDASVHSQAGNQADKQAATLGGGTDKARAATECQPGTLRAKLDTAGISQAGMNHRGTFLRVTNTGDETCVISGYAGVALEGAGHTAIETTARHGSTYFATDPGSHPITLAPGKSAWADLVWTTTGASTAHAKYLQISPTGSNSHSTAPFAQDLDNGTLSLTAWSSKPPING